MRKKDQVRHIPLGMTFNGELFIYLLGRSSDWAVWLDLGGVDVTNTLTPSANSLTIGCAKTQRQAIQSARKSLADIDLILSASPERPVIED